MVSFRESVNDNDMLGHEHQFIRPLGMSERFYWIYDTRACTNFAIVAEIVGDLSIDALKKAFSHSVARHPAYRLRVVAGPGHRLDYYAVDVQEALDGLDIAVADPGCMVDDVVADEIDTIFPSGSCPMVRSRILPNAPAGGTAVVFTFHHCMSDAVGAMALVREILFDWLSPESYRFPTRSDVVGPEITFANQEAYYPGRYRGWRKPSSLAALFAASSVDVLRMAGRPLLHGGRRSGFGRTIKLRTLSLEREVSNGMLNSCRAEGTTVHGLICAALLLALRDEMVGGAALAAEKETAATVVSAINMRRWLAGVHVPDHAPGMFASMIPTNHILSSGTTPWALARDVNHRLAATRERGAAHLLWQAMPPARLLPPNEKGGRRIHKLAAAGPKGPIVTNIGRIDPMPERLNECVASLSFAIGPGVNFPICAAVSSWGGRLFINCSYDEVVFESAFMDRVVARMKNYLAITPDSH